jgi:hypothetical protein
MSKEKEDAPVVNQMRKTERDENGLVVGVEYQFTEDGMVDWKKMVPKKYLVPNSQRGVNPDADVSTLKDHELIIKLGGLRYVAKLRGYMGFTYVTTSASPHYVHTKCSINWLPNYESEDLSVFSEGIGDAHEGNTDSFMKFYLAAAAENRSFVRCVRNYLNIAIVSDEEIREKGGKVTNNTQDEQDPGAKPVEIIQKLLAQKGKKNDWVKQQLVADGIDITDMTSLKDIPKNKLFEYTGKLKKLEDVY